MIFRILIIFAVSILLSSSVIASNDWQGVQINLNDEDYLSVYYQNLDHSGTKPINGYSFQVFDRFAFTEDAVVSLMMFISNEDFANMEKGTIYDIKHVGSKFLFPDDTGELTMRAVGTSLIGFIDRKKKGKLRKKIQVELVQDFAKPMHIANNDVPEIIGSFEILDFNESTLAITAKVEYEIGNLVSRKEISYQRCTEDFEEFVDEKNGITPCITKKIKIGNKSDLSLSEPVRVTGTLTFIGGTE